MEVLSLLRLYLTTGFETPPGWMDEDLSVFRYCISVCISICVCAGCKKKKKKSLCVTDNDSACNSRGGHSSVNY